MTALVQPLTRLVNWPPQRPVISLEWLALAVSMFFSAFCNGVFWQAYAATGAMDAAGGWVTAASLFVAMTGLNMLLLCLVLNRWTAKPVLTVLLVVTALAVYYMDQYTVFLDPDMIRSVLHTDAKESRELLTQGLLLSLLVYALVPGTMVWWVRLHRHTWTQTLLRRSLAMVVSLLVTAGAILFSFQDISTLMRNHREIRHLITPGNYLASLARVMLSDTGEVGLPRLTVGVDATATPRSAGKPRVLVVVVGETVRAANWGLNGYTRQTTPQLSRLDVVNFSDVTACGSSTEVSLPCMFSSHGRRNYDKQWIKRSESLLHVLDRAGIATRWRDNQSGCKGVCAGLPFESYLDAMLPEYCDGTRCMDEVLLHGLAQDLERSSGDQVIVLHQLGNHGPSYFSRYPARFGQYSPACQTPQLGDCSREQIVNAYDNAILYTDHFLAQTIRLLQAQTSLDTAMIYVSDHGESLGENNLYLHGVPYPIAPDAQLKVPMTVWFSPGFADSRGIDTRCLQQRAHAPASHDNLFSSVLGLMQVRTRDYDPAQDLFAPCTANPS